MKIVTVVGARPQFIKAAAVSHALRRAHTEVLVHTGQHYDPMLSDVFFAELGIPAPDETLHVGSAPHGAQTGRMLEAIESILLRERPDALLVYGDTNSTLAGALAAAKIGIPIVHVEAGLRSGVRDMPEEINRVLTDRLSAVCCCPSESARENLAREGIVDGVEVVGDVMLDALLAAADRVRQQPSRLATWRLTAGSFALATVHRAANTDNPESLAGIARALGDASSDARPVVWPMHPRTQALLRQHCVNVPSSVRVIAPVGYLDMVTLVSHASVVATDSGGLQKEAYWLGVPCVTLREETEWAETVKSGWNTLVGANPSHIVSAVQDAANRVRPHASRDAYGEPGASERVVRAIGERLHIRG